MNKNLNLDRIYRIYRIIENEKNRIILVF